MKGLDTNVLVRLATRDDPRQLAAAERYVRTFCSASDPCRVERIAICEAVWTLEASYGFRREALADFVEAILLSLEFALDEREALREALQLFRRSSAGFSDCLMGVVNRMAGCEATGTFDKQAAQLREFELVQAPKA